jgi:hypothetical protein
VHARSLEEALERKAHAPLFGNVDLIAREKHTRVSFEKIIEIKARGEYLVHEDAEAAIAAQLEGEIPMQTGIRITCCSLQQLINLGVPPHSIGTRHF